MRNSLLVHCHSTTQHDAGVAVLLDDGDVIALASERVTRFKHDGRPAPAYDYLRQRYPFSPHTIDCFHDVTARGYERDRHHRYHAAGAFYASPFREAAVLIVDGQGHQNGELVSVSLWSADRRGGLTLIETDRGSAGSFHARSVGHFYTAVGALAGMSKLFEEGKTMALAAFGGPSEFLTWMRRYAASLPDGTCFIDERFLLAVLGNTFGPLYYDWERPAGDVQTVWDEYLRLRGRRLRDPGEDPYEEDRLVAYAGQLILEEIMEGLARRAARLTGSRNLCLAGGVALNCPANTRIAESGAFDAVYVCAAPGDDGQALGKLLDDARARDFGIRTRSAVYLGPEYSSGEIAAAIAGAPEWRVAARGDDAVAEAAEHLAGGDVGAIFSGRSELGPRALGHRSIVAHPQRLESRERINREIKHREWWRPVAPAVLAEATERYFANRVHSPYMSFVGYATGEARREIPAALHVDGTARLQTVTSESAAILHALIRRFEALTGIGAVINTSFNDQAPMVETPQDALGAAAAMRLDFLLCEDALLVPTTPSRRRNDGAASPAARRN